MLVLNKQHQRNVFFLSICPLRRAVLRKSAPVRSTLSMTLKSFAAVAREDVARRWGYFSQHFVGAGELGRLLEQLPGRVKLDVKAAPAACFDELSIFPRVERCLLAAARGTAGGHQPELRLHGQASRVLQDV